MRPQDIQKADGAVRRVPILRKPPLKTFLVCRKLEEEFTFERAEFAIPGISRRHFQIVRDKEGVRLIPLSDTNPIWLNGVLCQEERLLRPLDRIQTGLVSMLYVPGLLLVEIPEEYRNSQLCGNEPGLTRRIPLKTTADSKAQLSFPILDEPVSLEAPSIPPQAPAVHWFSVLGPSLMIMVSSLAGAAGMFLRPGADLQSVLQMSSTSLSMAGAFLAYGLINRKISARGAWQNQKKQEDLYLAYLKEREESLQEKNSRFRTVHEKQKASLCQLDEVWKGSQKKEGWLLPVAECRKTAPAFILPSIRYDQKEQKTAQALEAMEGASLWSPSLVCLKQNEVQRLANPSQRELEDLFLLWNWMVWHPGRRFVRIGKRICSLPWSEEWMEKLPSVFLEGKKLCFDSLQEFRTFAEKYREVEWTILCDMGCSEMQRTDVLSASWLVADFQENWQENLLVLDQRARTKERLLSGFLCEEKRRKNRAQGWPLLLQEEKTEAAAFRKQQACLEVILGVDEKGEEVKWDLEKEGPHALIAGTTGSGKSEGLASVLLQLALYNTASQVQFLLIDFKGGAFISQFQGLPHFAGALTNLEQSDFKRLQAALDQELERRQKKLQEFSALHPFAIQDVSTFNTFYPGDPLSHLFIVVDEFAQMKARFPEAMAYMQEAARIGRSLGIHLILATQKPAGIVDEQIWSNSRSRLCFMVHDEADSRQVLGHGKAAGLRVPGQFILQVSGAAAEKRGRALFSRSACRRKEAFVQVDENRRPVHEREKKSMAMRIQELAVQAENRGNLLLVDLEGPVSSEAFAFTDEISFLQPVELNAKENLFVLADEKGAQNIVERIVDCASMNVLKTEGISFPENLQSVPLDALWQLLDLHSEKMLLVIHAEELRNHPLQRELLQAGHISLLVLASVLETADARLAAQMDLRLAMNIQDRESLYLLFGRLVCDQFISGRGLCLRNQQMKSFVLSRPEEKKAKRKRKQPLCLVKKTLTFEVMRKLPPFFLGFSAETGRPLSWSRNRNLVIVCALERLKKPLEQLLACWKRQDPLLGIGSLQSSLHVSLLCLPQDQSLLMDPLLMQKIHNSSLLYIGTQYAEHQFLLKRRGRQDAGNLLWFEEDEGLCGRLPEFTDEERG